MSIHNFIYRDANWEKLFLDALRNVNINGVTVSVDQPRLGRTERKSMQMSELLIGNRLVVLICD